MFDKEITDVVFRTIEEDIPEMKPVVEKNVRIFFSPQALRRFLFLIE